MSVDGLYVPPYSFSLSSNSCNRFQIDLSHCFWDDFRKRLMHRFCNVTRTRAQAVDLRRRVTAEGYFHEGRPEGHWTRWYDNGQKREEFFITNGECAQAQHWDKDGVPI